MYSVKVGLFGGRDVPGLVPTAEMEEEKVGFAKCEPVSMEIDGQDLQETISRSRGRRGGIQVLVQTC